MREFVELLIWFNQNLLLSLRIFLHCSLWTDYYYVLFFFVRSYKMYLNVVTSHHGNIHRCHEYIFITICLLFYHSSFLLKHLIRIDQNRTNNLSFTCHSSIRLRKPIIYFQGTKTYKLWILNLCKKDKLRVISILLHKKELQT
jgi:hypothetical protein